MSVYKKQGIVKMQDMISQAAIGATGVRTMYDSTTMDAIPVDAQIVAGYPHAFATDYARFPYALQVRIDQHGNHADDCHAADVENGAIGIGTIRQWTESWHLLHPNGLDAVNGHFTKPTVYCDESNLGAVRTALVGLVYDLWVAWWGTGPTQLPGTVAHQYANSAILGFNADASVVYDTTWGIASVTPSPENEPVEEADLSKANAMILQASSLITAHLTGK